MNQYFVKQVYTLISYLKGLDKWTVSRKVKLLASSTWSGLPHDFYLVIQADDSGIFCQMLNIFLFHPSLVGSSVMLGLISIMHHIQWQSDLDIETNDNAIILQTVQIWENEDLWMQCIQLLWRNWSVRVAICCKTSLSTMSLFIFGTIQTMIDSGYM